MLYKFKNLHMAFFFVIMLFSCLISNPSKLYAINNVGVAYFGIQSKFWPCKASFKALKNVKNIHLSFLYRTFGTRNQCLYKFIEDERFQSLEIHLTNGSALRNKILRPYEALRGETVSSLNRKLESRDRKILRIFKRELNRANREILSKLKQHQACIISPILEHNLSSGAEKVLFTYLSRVKPKNCLLASNAAGFGGSFPKGADLSEGHGKHSIVCRNCINNLDGTDIDFPIRRTRQPSNSIRYTEVMRYIEQRRISVLNFLWIQEFNGKKDSSTRSDTRTRKDYPSLRLFKEVIKFIIKAEKKKKPKSN